MELRLLGVVVILLSAGGAGAVMSRSYQRRPLELSALLDSLTLLQSEVYYMRNTLPEALQQTAAASRAPACELCQTAAEHLLSEPVSARFAWEEACRSFTHAGLKAHDIDVLLTLAPVLGRSSADEQRRHLEHLQQKLRTLLQEAERERDKNSGLWHYLGFCFGAIVVVLLY